MIVTTSKNMRPRDPYDHYPTPSGLIRQVLSDGGHLLPRYILDPGAGSGAWGHVAREVWPSAIIAGTDLRPLPRPRVYDYWQTGVDFRGMTAYPHFDLVMGNPPFKHAEEFVRLGMASLQDGAFMVYLLRLAFLEGEGRGAGLWRTHQPFRVSVCVKRPSFTGDGKTDGTAYGIYYWQKGRKYGRVDLDWLYWNEDPLPQASVYDLPLFASLTQGSRALDSRQ